jgi:cell division cycle 14
LQLNKKKARAPRFRFFLFFFFKNFQFLQLWCGDQMTMEGEMLPVIEGRLYLTCTSSASALQPKKDEVMVTLKTKMCYMSYCADFGPLNLCTTHRMGKKLQAMLSNPTYCKTKIIVCTSTDAADITNTVTVLASFLCLDGFSVAQALSPFKGLHHGLIIPFRDATWVRSTFDLTIEDCLAGLQRAVSAGIFKQDEFDPSEYSYYDHPLKGDMHEVVPGKFIAFRGPVRDQKEGALENGDWTMSASEYLNAFKGKNVSTIIRLNSIEYSAAVFKRAGFKHFDLPFKHCEVPSDSIVDKFLRIAEEAQGVVAVHSRAGLGRTGTLIALYLMKHHSFTAREAMGWLRICRPGSIIGPQQHYLEQQQSRMHMLGGQGCAGLGAIEEVKEQCTRPHANCPDDARASSQPDVSAMLAEMVRKGMHLRDCLRLGALPQSFSWSDQEVRPAETSQTHARMHATISHKSTSELREDAESVCSRAATSRRPEKVEEDKTTSDLREDTESVCSRADISRRTEKVACSIDSSDKSTSTSRQDAESVYSRADTICRPKKAACSVESETQRSVTCFDEDTHSISLVGEVSAGPCLQVGCHALGGQEGSEAQSDMQGAHDMFLYALSDLQLSSEDTRVLVEGSTGTQFTCFTGTKVRSLTQATGAAYRGIVRNELEVAVKVMLANLSEHDTQQRLAALRQVMRVGLRFS